ncbi:MAG TPA: peroxiredoxin family protein [Candidatus Sulfotelmatobacter sp.]|nr:peroxiredoxin family protein [Candidatus Sulfotelmatobacter sp.]
MKLKKIDRCKQLFAILTCAFPLMVNAQMDGMAHDTMNTTNSDQMSGTNSDNMQPSSKMGGMGSDNMRNTNTSQMGTMSPVTNTTPMDNMASGMMSEANPPGVGSLAPDFTLNTLDGQSVRLDDLTAKGKVVLVVLRGWPGYQCPFCSRQARDFMNYQKELMGDGVQVVMVYPGPSDDLKSHAADFLKDKDWPKDFLLVLDPDYSFTKAYGLRWDAPRETAYPSTFIIGKDNKVIFAHISKKHGDRVKADTVLKALDAGSMGDGMMKPGM